VPIALERAAQGHAIKVLLEWRRHRASAIVEERAEVEEVACVEAIVAAVVVRRSVEIVRSRSRDDVDLRAGAPAESGVGIRRDHPKLADGFGGHEVG